MDTPLSIPPSLDRRAQCPPLCIPNTTRLSHPSPPLWITILSMLPDRRLVSSPFSLSCSYSDSTRMSYAKHTSDTTLPKHICVRETFIVSEMYDAQQRGPSFKTPLPHAIDGHNDLRPSLIADRCRSYFLRMIYVQRPRRTLIFSRVLSGNRTICNP